MGIGKNIKQILKENGQTIDWLSKQTEISVHTLYGITKKDDVKVREQTIRAIAECLNVSTEELIHGSKKPTVQQVKSIDEKPMSVNNPASTSNPSQQNSKFSQSQLSDSKSIEQIDLDEFMSSLKHKKEEINNLRKTPPNTIPQEALRRIIKRKENEIELLLNFYDLHPHNQKVVLTMIKYTLINQRIYEPYGTHASYNSDDPVDVDKIFSENYNENLTLQDLLDRPDPTDKELEEEYLKYEEETKRETQAEQEINQERLERIKKYGL